MIKSRYMSSGLVAVILATCLAAIAYSAAATNPPSVIYACANTTNGQMRLAATPADCKDNESPLSWNQGPSSGFDFKVFSSTAEFLEGGELTTTVECGEGYVRVSLLDVTATNHDASLVITGVYLPQVNTVIGATIHTEAATDVTTRILCVQIPPAD